ncbi:OTU-domain-containing protein [Peniophora sp. CONT]|nr:OTU-domain-containing protein [Peniophora sp. CONT]
MDDLLAQLDARDASVQQETAAIVQEVVSNGDIDTRDSTAKEKKDPRSRWRARQARKAQALTDAAPASDADADARLQREAEEEEKTIKKMLDTLDLEMHEINPDGHCLFSAVADQLALLGILSGPKANYVTTRHAATGYMLSHSEDFLPFLPSEIGDDIMSQKEFEGYCATMRDTGTWGGEPEILALCRVYNVPIHVVQSGQPHVVVHDPNGADAADDDLKHAKACRISYHRRMYGLGEHYNSLRPRLHGIHRVTSPLKNLVS